MKTKGTVQKIDTDGRAVVSCLRESACDGCHKKEEGSCSVCSLMGAGQEMKVTVKNSLGAAVGDQVEVETKSERVLLYAALVFFVPVVLVLAVYGIVTACSDAVLVCALACCGSFAAYFIGLRFFSEKVVHLRDEVVMTAILMTAGGEEKTPETENNIKDIDGTNKNE